MSATAEEARIAVASGEEPATEPAEELQETEEPIGREELIDAIVAELQEHPEARDRLIAEIYIEASSHRQLLEQIAGTMAELLRDPKRIVRAFFGRGRKRGKVGDDDELVDLAAIAAPADEEGCEEC